MGINLKGNLTGGNANGAHGLWNNGPGTCEIEGNIQGGGNINAHGAVNHINGTIRCKNNINSNTGVALSNTYHNNLIGTFELSGTNNQTYNQPDTTPIGHVRITKTGGQITLNSNITCNSLETTGSTTINENTAQIITIEERDGLYGTATINGTTWNITELIAQSHVTITNSTIADCTITCDDLTVIGPATVTGTVTIIVAGDFNIIGTEAARVIWRGPDLIVSGEGNANWTLVENSDASAGNTIRAVNSYDFGGNLGWLFVFTISELTEAWENQHLIKRTEYTVVPKESIWFQELTGSRIIEPTAFEPDPTTYRGEYYYNAIRNILYKKIITRKKPVHAFWQKVSN